MARPRPNCAFLDQIEEGQTLVAVPLRDRDDEPQVRLDHLLLLSAAVAAARSSLRELDLLSGGEQFHLADDVASGRPAMHPCARKTTRESHHRVRRRCPSISYNSRLSLLGGGRRQHALHPRLGVRSLAAILPTVRIPVPACERGRGRQYKAAVAMNGENDETPALRASDAGREQTVELLRRHTVDGRLTLEEFALTRRLGSTPPVRGRSSKSSRAAITCRLARPWSRAGQRRPKRFTGVVFRERGAERPLARAALPPFSPPSSETRTSICGRRRSRTSRRDDHVSASLRQCRLLCPPPA